MTEWYRSGIKSIDEVVGRNVHLTTPQLFRLATGETRRFLIVDSDLRMVAHLHRKKLFDRWIVVPCNNNSTLEGGCAFCGHDKKNESRLRAPLTVFDLDGYIDASGVQRKYLHRLYLADDRVGPDGRSAIDFLADVFYRHGTLRGMIIEATQTTSTHFGIGEIFKEWGHVELDNKEIATKTAAKMRCNIEDLEAPFDYTTFIRPTTNERMRQMLAGTIPQSPQVDKPAEGAK